MKKLNQQGIAGTMVALIIVLVLAIGGVGYYVWNAKKNTESTLNNTVNSQGEPQKATKKAATKSVDSQPTPDPNAGYLVIKEWGVRIKMKEAAKLTYMYNAKPSDYSTPDETAIVLQVKPEYLQNKSCKTSVSMDRRKTPYNNGLSTFRLGDYYYDQTGSPYNCGNDADNALNVAARQDFTLNNLSAL